MVFQSQDVREGLAVRQFPSRVQMFGKAGAIALGYLLWGYDKACLPYIHEKIEHKAIDFFC